MPNIPEYSAPLQLVPKPTDIAANTAREAGMVENRFAREGGEALGSAISRVGSQIGAAVDQHVAATYIDHGSATSMQGYADMTQKWNQIAQTADPNDTSVAAGFNEKVFQPWAENFMKQFDDAPQRAQEWAQSTVDNMRTHMYEKVSADMATRAAAATTQNFKDRLQTAQATAALEPDAHTMQFLVDKFKADTLASAQASPYSTPEQLARVQTDLIPAGVKEIAKAQIYGAAQRNPDALIDAIKKGDYDSLVDKETLVRAQDFAQSQKTRQLDDAERQRAFNLNQMKDAAEQKQTDYITAIKSGDKGALAKAWADPAFLQFPAIKENIEAFSRAQTNYLYQQQEHGWQQQEHAWTAAAHARAMEDMGNPVQLRNLITTIHDQYEKDPNNVTDKPIWDALKSKDPATHIGYSDFERAEAAYKAIDNPLERGWNRQLSMVEEQIKKSPVIGAMAMTDPSGFANKVNQMDYDFHQMVHQYRTQGRDISDLVNPASPNRFLSPERINEYFGTAAAKQSVATQADQIRAGARTSTGVIVPAAGTIRDGYRFKGGNPADPASWEKQ